MKDFYPKVSIVIPVYNGSMHVGEAIESALAQTYKNLEIIVSNDGSNDNGATEAVAKSYGDKIIYLGKKENGGAATALNAAIKVMTGEYFSWLSHDDMYYPKKIQRQIEELGKLEDKNTIMMSDLDGINEKRKKIYQTDYAKHIEAYPPRLKSRIHPVIYNQTHGCTLLIPKVCFDEVGLFDAGERVAQDFELFHRAFLKYPHKLVSEVLVTARDTSNRMGRRAKPRASLEYSRLFVGILDNLSEADIQLLAKDKLELLSDMWSFFKAAGYLQANEYATSKITELTNPFCVAKISEYAHKTINLQELASELARLREQLSLVLCDKDKACRLVDNTVRVIITETGISHYKKDVDRANALHDTLVINGYKLSASTLLKIVIVYLSETKQTTKLNKTIITKITGHESLVFSEIPLKNKNSKPVIAFCSTHWLTGGMERVMSIVFEQIKNQYDVILITPFDGRGADINIPDGIRHIKITNAIFHNRYDSSILSIALIYNVDIIVGVFNLYGPLLDLYGLCKEIGIKTVASNHENFFYPYINYDLQKTAFKRLETFKSLDAVVWPTNYSAAISGLSSLNSYLMPNPNTFKPVVRKKQDEQAIICVGRFNDYIKRVDRMLRTFKLVQDRVPQSKLFLVGDCDRKKKNELYDNKSVDDMIVELGLDENNIVFTGNIPNVDDYYRRASVLMLTSGSEGFGMVINEAASFGVPTVYNAIAGLDDLITDGKNGFVVNQDDLTSMADKITEILTDKELADSMSNEALALSKRFDAVVIGKKWTHLFDSLLVNNHEEDLKERLDRELAYTINDESELSRQIFNEFDNISRILVGMQSNTSSESFAPRRRYSRLALSIDKDGKKTTAKKIIRKTFHKAGAERLFEHGLILNRSIRHHGLKKTAHKLYKKIV